MNDEKPKGNRTRPEKIKFYLTLVIVLISGGLLVAYTAGRRHSTEQTATSHVIADVEAAFPEFKSLSAEKLKTILVFWQDRLSAESLQDIMLRDFGLAMIIAVFLTLVIENYARNRLEEEMKSGIVEATFERLLPPLFFNQVRAHVIGADLVKENWRLRMVIREDPTKCGGTPDIFVSHTVVRYRLRSLAKHKVDAPLYLELDRDVCARDADGNELPRLVSVSIDNDPYDKEALESCLREEGTIFESHSPVDDNGIEVAMEIEELVRIPNTFVWTTSHLTDRTEITIDSSAVKGLRFAVEALHPEPKRLRETVKGTTWEFLVGMLPCQGFQIRGFYPERRRIGNTNEYPTTPASTALALQPGTALPVKHQMT